MTSILSRKRSEITFLMGNMHETTTFCYRRTLHRSHRVIGHLDGAESSCQRTLGWDATLTVHGRAPQQAAARRTLSSARREARGADVDLLLHRACEADQGERLRRADRAVEAVGSLLQLPKGAYSVSHSVRAGVACGGVACSSRAQARTGSACRSCTCGRAGTCAPRAASREAATRCPGSWRTAAHGRDGHGRRLFIPCGRARASAALPLGRTMPRAPADTAAPSRAPLGAPFRKLRAAIRSSARSAKPCATRSFRFAAAPSVVRSSSDGTQDASETFEVR